MKHVGIMFFAVDERLYSDVKEILQVRMAQIFR